ncbi:MAG: NAD(P)/FAD-dependent oxidoreductase [Clostridiaceae bacterium]
MPDILILGGGPAGFYAASTIRKKNVEKSITIITKESIPAYYRPQLSNYLALNENKDYLIKDRNWYVDNKIDIITDKKISKINTNEKYVELNDDKIYFDKLILANGASNFIPPIPGVEKKSVLALRTKQDAETIKNYMTNSKKAIIVGGGLLGLEAAVSMIKKGLDVTVIEKSEILLPRQLDTESSKTFFNIIQNSGIKVLCGTSIKQINGNEEVKSVILENNEELECDLLLFSIGIRSNINITKGTTIECNRGILVNDKMETSISDVYACGDVAEFNNIVYGNWTAAMEMGKIAGNNILGEETYFKGFTLSSVFNGLDTSIFSIGDVCSQYEEKDILDLSILENNIIKKCFFKDNILKGAILIGDTKKSVKLISGIKKAINKEEVASIFK